MTEEQNKELPKQQPEISEPTKTMGEVFDETLNKAKQNKDIDISIIEKLKNSYEKERLNVSLDTQKEIDDLTLSLDDAFLKSPDEIRQVFDDTFRREEAEDEINKFDKGEGVETVSDLRELSVNKLLELEKKHEGILLFAFTDFISFDQKFDIETFNNFYKKPEHGQKFQISFRGNPEAEMKIGATDIFPPSIRTITVLEQNDPERSRTSERRVGLKGGGFYDRRGYIPVFSGDVVRIGGANSVETGIDMDFDKKYRNEKGELDMEKYNKDFKEENDKFIDNLPLSAQRGKTMTSEEIDALMKDIDASGNGKKVVEAIQSNLYTLMGLHCWDWVNKIYRDAGVKSRQILPFKKYQGKDCKDVNYNDKLSLVKPGDWIYINNKNPYDTYGCHSGIFLGWTDEAHKIAKMASCPGAGKVGRIQENVNLKDNPVTYLSKPV